MDSRTSTPEWAFTKALNSFQTGGITYADFLGEVKKQIAAGASPSTLREMLDRREFLEPLPGYVHDAVVGLLQSSRLPPPAPDASAEPGEAVASASAGAASSTPASPKRAAAAEAATIILGEAGDDEAAAPFHDEADQRTPIAVGDELLGRFHLVELIGEGGMSRVFKAIDSTPAASYATESFIALKILTRPFDEHSGLFSTLQDEVQRLEKLTHPHIVRMFGCGRDGATVFLTMEYLAGESLYGRLRGAENQAQAGAGMERDQAIAIIRAVAGALDYAHRNEVVHGDLKPGNVILTTDRDVKVIDFGMTAWMGRPKSALERRETAAKVAAVTPRYASPQLMARQKPAAADDVYSLACLAYELLTGSHPFDESDGTLTARFPPPPHKGLTAPQYAAVVHGLQREHRQRTVSIAQFIEEFSAPAPRKQVPPALLWVAAAVLLLGLGWFLARRLPHPTEGSEARVGPSAAPVASARPTPAAGTEIRDCPTCPLMTVLPPGRFQQGSDAGTSRFEQPPHTIAIAHPLAVATNDVTVGEFREFVAATNRDMQGCETYDGAWRREPKASWEDPGFTQSAQHPVTCTSWNDATAYALWISEKTGQRYRLPSAAEWEYAASSGGAVLRPWETNGSGPCANANVADESAAHRYPGWEVFSCDDGFVYTAPVGSFKPNAFGLNDMLGNVFQWTADCWHEDYVGVPDDGSPRALGDCREHELRGGSWFSSPEYVRASYRNHFATDYRTSSVGFRLVRDLKP